MTLLWVIKNTLRLQSEALTKRAFLKRKELK